eukprot:SAG31_NODE_3421_length_4296_cov_2.302121_3_plen_184_part_00
MPTSAGSMFLIGSGGIAAFALGAASQSCFSPEIRPKTQPAQMDPPEHPEPKSEHALEAGVPIQRCAAQNKAAARDSVGNPECEATARSPSVEPELMSKIQEVEDAGDYELAGFAQNFHTPVQRRAAQNKAAARDSVGNARSPSVEPELMGKIQEVEDAGDYELAGFAQKFQRSPKSDSRSQRT